MQPDYVVDLVRGAMRVCVMLCAPLLVVGLLVGVITNIFQAVTQISETTLAVVPKLLAMFGALVLFSPWMIDLITSFTVELFDSIPLIVR